MRRCALALLAALALVGASCGKDTKPAQVVTGAPDKTVEAGTSRVFVAVAVAGGPQPARFHGEGVFDYSADRGRLSFDASSLGLPGTAAGPADAIVAGNVIYVKLPAGGQGLQARPWLKLDLAALARHAGLDLERLKQVLSSDPTGWLHFLRGVSDDARQVGTEDVRGTETTRYAATVDLDKAARQAPPEARDQVSKAAQRLGTTTLPVETWIDDEGRLRRERFTVDLSKVTPLGGAPPPAAGMLTTTVELFDFGVDVEVSEPPPEQVTDLTTLVGQLEQLRQLQPPPGRRPAA